MVLNLKISAAPRRTGRDWALLVGGSRQAEPAGLAAQAPTQAQAQASLERLQAQAHQAQAQVQVQEQELAQSTCSVCSEIGNKDKKKAGAGLTFGFRGLHRAGARRVVLFRCTVLYSTVHHYCCRCRVVWYLWRGPQVVTGCHHKKPGN